MDSSDEEEISHDLLKSVVKECDNSFVQESMESLMNAFNSGAICLICISKVKKTEKIWSCEKCYCFFHLPCLQRWANNSLGQRKIAQELAHGYYNNEGVYIPKEVKPLVWDCPKCRETYQPDEIPRHFTCFCKKTTDPEPLQWRLPFSCGDHCLKKRDCGHSCLLLCHPGACPQCPQVLTTSCECGKSNPKAIRCFELKWNCMKKCGKRLDCGHSCEGTCHRPDNCPPCMKRSQQRCNCGSTMKEGNCYEGKFICKKICGKQYLCNVHKCEKICCNDCGDCVLGKQLTCPCGKQKKTGTCTEVTTSCGDTCGKLLACGLHTCSQRCHSGDCSDCTEIVEKKCRCGLFTKEIACSKQVLCETKCKNLRSCKSHPCSRKCCANQCPPCDKICGKILSCGKQNHRCTSLCHEGYCYPCTQEGEVKCRCGATMKKVPCGREKRTRPPKCYQPCKIKSKCRHLQKHSCHFDICPPCQQKCNEILPCSHECGAKCHDYVKIKVKDNSFKASTPWEVASEWTEFKKLDHPPCEFKVPVTCIGGHETSLWPCYNSQPTSCGRPCNRKLRCTNHTCDLQCHAVKDQNSLEEDESCHPCNEDCQKPRPDGCTHPCKRPCHPPPCTICYQPIKLSCFCGLMQVQFKCADYHKNTDLNTLKIEREKLLSCGNRCSKQYPCGHRCTAICHSGACPNPNECKKKSKVQCQCGLRRVEVACDKLRDGFRLVCDQTCQVKKKEQALVKEEQDRLKKEKEEEERRKEFEEYEAKFGQKKQYKQRKKVVIEQEDNTQRWKIILGTVSVIILIAAIFFIIYSRHN